ncbi:hypothetical protein FA048_13875 [Pedobacter polaris]|uniref:Uncharacterized protein n=1 Tax=Pedobacter polaris TaxID=2571273 RepID=A0A4U1CRK1_9SPHI|nr:hypothetical protein [Pedobacter polaris]TKC08241.1 hypothetical protein FA048_13875 [Pedobacter polaris]
MITPENNIPLDDSQNSEAEDQQSQKDIHSNGFDDTNVSSEEEEEPQTDMLKQAYDASEPSYILDAGEDDDE